MTKNFIIKRGRWNDLKSNINLPNGIVYHINQQFDKNPNGLTLDYFEKIMLYLQEEDFLKVKTYLDDFFKEDTNMNYEKLPLYKEDNASTSNSSTIIVLEEDTESSDELSQDEILKIIDKNIEKEKERIKKKKDTPYISH
jgi:hypothetical protein